ncbi:MAG: glycoside hydrolase family 3 N-terminal domain-containing protein [Desulfocapsaceae bacterium]|jgi:beta-N-acetylhexosaminidase|nr:glycoside hydrolase family 3 N-terminal domain-containing protein [Desulfocapsaceae bacterium]
MNLKNHLGELFIVGFQGSDISPAGTFAQQLESCIPGGVILFERTLSGPERGGNISSSAQLKKLTTDLHNLSSQPLLVCVDQEGGLVQRLNSGNGFFDTCSAEEMGSTETLELTCAEALRCAENLSHHGINVNFAPCVDLNINSNNPIIGKLQRCFSADPDRVSACAEAWITCHRQHDIISCLKHFPGHGSSTADSHLGFVDISSCWEHRELLPYRRLINKKMADMVMVGHLFHHKLDPASPATLSFSTVTGLLREKLGYDGVVVTDDMQMKAISNHYGFGEAICRSLEAGIDMIVIGNNLDYRKSLLSEAIEAVEQGIESGVVREETIIAALSRINHLKRLITD